MKGALTLAQRGPCESCSLLWEPVAALRSEIDALVVARVGVGVLEIEEQASWASDVRPGMPGSDMKLDDGVARHAERDDVLDPRPRAIAGITRRRDCIDPFLALHRAQALR